MKTLSRAYQKVLEFYIQKKLPYNTGLDQYLLGTQMSLIEEEAGEVRFEGRHLSGECGTTEDLAATVKEVLDVIYVCQGFFVVLGLDPSDLFDIVHEANLNKEGEINERGKFVKGPNYQCPVKRIQEYLERKFTDGRTQPLPQS